MTLLLLACVDPADSAASSDTDTDTDTDTDADTDTDTDSDSDSDSDTDPPPDDADADGHLRPEAGGDDCDDTNRWVYPGAPEYCDPIDQDCDGVASVPGSCTGEAVSMAMGHLVVDSEIDAFAAGSIGDVTGDGLTDLGVRRTFYQDILIYAGDPTYTVHDGEPEGAWHHIGEDLSYGMDFPTTGGDIDGDGMDDMYVPAAGFEVSVWFGPIDGPGAYSRMGYDAEAFWDSEYIFGYYEHTFSGTDVDGDGFADAMAINYNNEHVDLAGDIAYQIYFGGTEGQLDGCAVHSGGSVYSAFGAKAIGDGDGDGLPEVALNIGSSTFVVRGSDIRSLCYLTPSEIASAWQVGEDQARTPLGGVGDLNGDGVSEFAAGTGNEDAGEDAVYFWSADDVLDGEFDTTIALGSYLTSGSGYEIATVQTISFDGTGTPNLLLTEGVGGPAILLPGGVVPSLHEPLPERHLRLDDLSYGATCSRPCVGDFDGDGLEDLVTSYSPRETTEADIFVIPGFEVPWNDATYW